MSYNYKKLFAEIPDETHADVLLVSAHRRHSADTPTLSSSAACLLRCRLGRFRVFDVLLGSRTVQTRVETRTLARGWNSCSAPWTMRGGWSCVGIGILLVHVAERRDRILQTYHSWQRRQDCLHIPAGRWHRPSLCSWRDGWQKWQLNSPGKKHIE